MFIDIEGRILNYISYKFVFDIIDKIHTPMRRTLK